MYICPEFFLFHSFILECILGHNFIIDSNLKKHKKLNLLLKNISEMNSLVLAYSGGVDSTFLAVIAYSVLGNKMLAIIADSPSLPESEFNYAIKNAQKFEIPYRVIKTQELKREDYIKNNSNRCYFCKDELYIHLKTILRDKGFKFIVNGTNFDDLGDHRPGLIAAKDHTVFSPLAEVCLTKKDIRDLSKLMGLPTWDKPAQACLSSRIPYGTKVSVNSLNKIEKAEKYLHQQGFNQVRVRHHDNIARIEIPQKDFNNFFNEDRRKNITEYLKSLGYLYVTIDLDGFRSGSLNDVLNLSKNSGG